MSDTSREYVDSLADSADNSDRSSDDSEAQVDGDVSIPIDSVGFWRDPLDGRGRPGGIPPERSIEARRASVAISWNTLSFLDNHQLFH